MRITVDTPAELVASHRPRLLPLLLSVMIVAVLVRAAIEHATLSTAEVAGTVLGVATGAIVAALACRSSEFRFDAAAGELRWARWGLLSRARGLMPLDSVLGVEIERNRHGAGKPGRVVLETTQGRLPLTWHYSGLDPLAETKRTITLWLRNYAASRLPLDS